jgi:hypothetical protein
MNMLAGILAIIARVMGLSEKQVYNRFRKLRVNFKARQQHGSLQNPSSSGRIALH